MALARQGGQKDLVLERFESRAADYTTWYDGDNFSAFAFRRKRERNLDLISQEPPGKVLDIGCGPGVLIGELINIGNEVWGVDAAPEMIKQCRMQFGGETKAHFSTGHAEKLDFADRTFDTITALGLVEYLADDKAAIREMNRVLKPRGLVIITCPHYWAPWRRLNALYWRLVQPLRKLLGRAPYSQIIHREYRESSYRKLLESHGFEVVDVCYYGFGVIPTPFDRKLSRLQFLMGCKLASQARGPFRKLGMGFNIAARKQEA
jgi:ubiquinone/menaquinone biosynthesis C-methylase UbiE